MNFTTTSVIKALLLFFLFFSGLHYAKVFLMPLCIGGILATLFLPFCKWLEGKKIPKGLAVLSCLIVLLGITSGIIVLFSWQLSNLTQDLTLIKQRGIQTIQLIQEFIFNQLGITLETQSKILKSEQPSVSNVLQTVAGSIAYIFSNLILILVYLFCLLYYRNHIKNSLLKLIPIAKRAKVERVIYSSAEVSQHYLVGLTKMIVCLWIMYGIGFGILGVKNAFFFAILCGVLEIVPYIGNIAGTTLTVFAAAVQGGSVLMLGGILGVYGLVQFIQGWMLEPFIVGKQVKINPFATIIALVIGNIVWSIPGIFLAIPLIAIFKIVCDNIESLKPYGLLIGEVKTKNADPIFIKHLKTHFKKKTKPSEPAQ